MHCLLQALATIEPDVFADGVGDAIQRFDYFQADAAVG